jgi:hypothetical protein
MSTTGTPKQRAPPPPRPPPSPGQLDALSAPGSFAQLPTSPRPVSTASTPRDGPRPAPSPPPPIPPRKTPTAVASTSREDPPRVNDPVSLQQKDSVSPVNAEVKRLQRELQQAKLEIAELKTREASAQRSPRVGPNTPKPPATRPPPSYTMEPLERPPSPMKASPEKPPAHDVASLVSRMAWADDALHRIQCNSRLGARVVVVDARTMRTETHVLSAGRLID